MDEKDLRRWHKAIEQMETDPLLAPGLPQVRARMDLGVPSADAAGLLVDEVLFKILSEHSFRPDWEPIPYGLQLEDLLDRVNWFRLHTAS